MSRHDLVAIAQDIVDCHGEWAADDSWTDAPDRSDLVEDIGEWVPRLRAALEDERAHLVRAVVAQQWVTACLMWMATNYSTRDRIFDEAMAIGPAVDVVADMLGVPHVA